MVKTPAWGWGGHVVGRTRSLRWHPRPEMLGGGARPSTLADIDKVHVSELERLASAADRAAVPEAAPEDPGAAGRGEGQGIVARELDAPKVAPAAPPAPLSPWSFVEGLVRSTSGPELQARLVSSPEDLDAPSPEPAARPVRSPAGLGSPEAKAAAPDPDAAAPAEPRVAATEGAKPGSIARRAVGFSYAVVNIFVWFFGAALARLARTVARHPKFAKAPPAAAAAVAEEEGEGEGEGEGASVPNAREDAAPDDPGLAAAAAAVAACVDAAGAPPPKAAWGGAGVFRPLLDFRVAAAPAATFRRVWEDGAFYKGFLEESGDYDVSGEAWARAPDGSRRRAFRLQHPLGIPVPRWVGVTSVPTVKEQRAFVDHETSSFAVYETSSFTGIPYGETLSVETVCRILSAAGGGARVRVAFRCVLSPSFPTWLSGIIVYKTEAELNAVYGRFKSLVLDAVGAAPADP